MTPPLTIGMATFDDTRGTWFTLHSLAMHQLDEIQECELLVVHNDPNGPSADKLKNQVRWLAQIPGLTARYVPAGEVVGTSYPRDKVFREAAGEAVLCLDSHVLLVPGAIRALRDYYAEHVDSRDLLSGPLLDGRHGVSSTQFDDVWRHNMWGVWGRDPRGDDPSTPRFEVFAHGLGLFSCRKEAWLGFNEHHRGFGGEECYIHEKFRQAGARCFCLPALRWLHCFIPPAVGRRWPLRQWDRVRNYVLEHQELGLPLDRVHRHFVEAQGERQPDGKMSTGPTTVISETDWKYLLADPVGHTDPPRKPSVGKGCAGCGKGKPGKPAAPQAPKPAVPRFHVRGREGLYAQLVATPSDINEHLPTLREYAAQSDVVIEFGVRTARSTIALLCGQPRVLRSYDLRESPQAKVYTRWRGRTDYRFRQADVLDVEPEPCDLLFIDTRHTAEQITAELDRHAGACRRWIALHDTKTFGERGEGGGPGLLVGLRAWLRGRPEWGVSYRAEHNNGLMILSRVDKRPLPTLAKRAQNFLLHSIDHLLDGRADVSREELEARLNACALCQSRSDQHCSECGCPIAKKALWRSSYCDRGFWPLLEAKPPGGAK